MSPVDVSMYISPYPFNAPPSTNLGAADGATFDPVTVTIGWNVELATSDALFQFDPEVTAQRPSCPFALNKNP